MNLVDRPETRTDTATTRLLDLDAGEVRQLAEEVRRIAEERPDVVARCQYVITEDEDESTSEQRPGCIVGTAIWNLWGDSNPDVIDWLASKGVNGQRFRSVITEVTASALGGSWLNRVQQRQDNGGTWGEAVEEADEFVYGEGVSP